MGLESGSCSAGCFWLSQSCGCSPNTGPHFCPWRLRGGWMIHSEDGSRGWKVALAFVRWSWFLLHGLLHRLLECLYYMAIGFSGIDGCKEESGQSYPFWWLCRSSSKSHLLYSMAGKASLSPTCIPGRWNEALPFEGRTAKEFAGLF